MLPSGRAPTPASQFSHNNVALPSPQSSPLTTNSQIIVLTHIWRESLSLFSSVITASERWKAVPRALVIVV
ncbi:hypothetical protein PM082_021746 [Marasmius tenuissimus]|nr:hypothetical protein PM082_021746 [Marasmius tenuissimus]